MSKSESKITIISIAVGIIGIFSSVYIYSNTSELGSQNITVINNTSALPKLIIHNKTDVQTPKNILKNTSPSINSRSKLIISATGANVKIKESKNGVLYPGGEISSTGINQIIYIPKGQPLTIDLTGTGVDLKISNNIADQIAVNNSGTGANVSVF